MTVIPIIKGTNIPEEDYRHLRSNPEWSKSEKILSYLDYLPIWGPRFKNCSCFIKILCPDVSFQYLTCDHVPNQNFHTATSCLTIL